VYNEDGTERKGVNNKKKKKKKADMAHDELDAAEKEYNDLTKSIEEYEEAEGKA
jgi:hypothetical protein